MVFRHSTRPVVPAPFTALAALLLAFPLAGSAATVWVASSSDKIGPKVAPPAALTTAATLSAAKNEFEAFQIAITGSASNVSATATALTGPAGTTIPAPRLYREALIDVASASAVDGASGYYPDALVPDVDELVGEKRNAFPFNVGASETRVLWAEVHVPASAPAGTYAGSVTVRVSGASVVVPVTLSVWDFSLPSTASLRSYYGLSYGNLLAGHGLVWDAQVLPALRARYTQLGLDHRLSLSGTDDGANTLDHFAQWYGAFCDGTAPTQLQGAKLTSILFRPTANDSATVKADASSWAAFFKARGWFDRLFDYTCDEPPTYCQNQSWSDITTRSQAVKAGDASFRTLVTTTLADADAHGVTKAIDILTPVVNDLDNKPGFDNAGPQRSKYDAFLAARPIREVWTYQSCMSHGCGGNTGDAYFTGWPSYIIDALSLRARSEEWLSFLYDVTGELYYDTVYAYGVHDVWTSQATSYGGSGDGTLFYPGTIAKIGGTTQIPVASLRLKMIREGMEDFEYLKALTDAGDPQLARDLASALFPNAWTEPTAAQLLSTRRAIAERIVALLHPTSTSPGQPASAAPDLGTDPAAAPEPVVSKYTVGGAGCSAGVAAEIFAGLGVFAALALRRRRR